jgi:putative DNA primase/helicase
MVERIRRDGLVRRLDPLRRRAARWVADHRDALRIADPAMPEALDDRQADNWRPLLAIADVAGGAWAALARRAARTLAGSVVEADQAAPVQLLTDLRDLFATTPDDKLATAAILRYLTTLEDRPWADYARGEPLTPRQLARLLDGFHIKARQIRQGSATRKGYVRADFIDVFRRYLASETPKHRNGIADLASPPSRSTTRTDVDRHVGRARNISPVSVVSDIDV